MAHKDIPQLITQYKKIMQRQDDPRVFFSPGRVNLIGEHIDYNGGLVFPAAIDLGTYGLIGKRTDQKIRLYSKKYKKNGVLTFNLLELAFDRSHGWANYVKGILHEMIKRGSTIDHGFDFFIYGDLPTASGLSSSASLEVLAAYSFNQLYDLKRTRTELALLSQDVENGYMGMHCGIMDQLIIALGIKDKALLMQTDTLDVEPVDAAFKGYQWIIMNTNYQRKTTDSKYNQRVKECQKGLAIIKQKKAVTHLCALNPDDLTWIKPLIKNELIYQRVRHVITEQARTLASKKALIDHDALAFGRLLNQSHDSLKDDYDVTGIYLDTLVDAARSNGAIGARVTGAGFGGCAIALVPTKALKSFKTDVSRVYKTVTGLIPSFYDVSFEDGVHEVTL